MRNYDHHHPLLGHTKAHLGGGSTAAAPQRNLTKEMQQTLQGYQDTNGGYEQLSQQSQPFYTQLSNYDNAISQNGYYNADGSYQPGSVALGQQANASNRAAAVNSLNTTGLAGTTALLGANPLLAEGLGLQSSAANNAANPGSLLQMLNGQAGSGQAGGASPGLLSTLTGAAGNLNTGQTNSPLLQTLQGQSQAQLAQNGQLSAQQARDVSQQAQAGFAARGAANTNSSLAADLFSRSNAVTQRQQAAQQFAGNVQGLLSTQNSQNQAARGQAENFGLGTQSANLASLANQQGFGLNVQNANLAQQGLAGQLAGNYANTASSSITNPLLQMLGFGNLNPGYSGSSGANGTQSAISDANTLFNPQSSYANDVYSSNQNATAYNNAANANASAAQNSALIGLFGSLLSDERLKKNVRDTGETTQQGIPIKDFSYTTDPKKRRFRGVMAQDVEKVAPFAVLEDPISGVKAVNYPRLGISMQELLAA